jgi:trigger factor
MPPQDFANEIVKAGNLPAMMSDIRRNKALATVLEHAAITDASGNRVDLSALSADAQPAPGDGTPVVADVSGDESADE